MFYFESSQTDNTATSSHVKNFLNFKKTIISVVNSTQYINLYLVLFKMTQKSKLVMWLRNHSHEKMRDSDMTAAQLVLCSTALMLRQDSGVH